MCFGDERAKGQACARVRGAAADLSGVKFYCITFRKRHDGTRAGRGRCIMSIHRASSDMVLRRGDPSRKFQGMRAGTVSDRNYGEACFRDSINGPRGPMAASLHTFHVEGMCSRRRQLEGQRSGERLVHVIFNDATTVIAVRDKVSGARAR